MACSPMIRTLTLHGSAKASLTARTSDFSHRADATQLIWFGGKNSEEIVSVFGFLSFFVEW